MNPLASIPRALRDPAFHFAQMRIEALEADNRRLRAQVNAAQAVAVQLTEELREAQKALRMLGAMPWQRDGGKW